MQIQTIAGRTFSLCVLPYLWVAANSWHTFTGYSRFYITAGVVLNSLLLTATTVIAAVTARHVPSFPVAARRLVWLGAAVLITISFVYNFLVFMPWAQAYKLATLPIVLALALAAVVSARTFKAIAAGLAIAVLLAIAQATLLGTGAGKSRLPAPATSQVPAPAPLATTRKLPNIYLLMFDAMSSSAHYQSTFGNAPPWQQYLISQNLREVPGALSSRPYSIQSVIDILQERPMPWSEFGESPALESANLSIDSRSPAVDRAHALGYRVGFLYQNNYFGQLHPLSHLDAYLPERSIGLCSLTPIRVGFHLCRGTNAWVERLLGETNEILAHQQETRRFMERIINEGHPWITWSYIAVPEHTSLAYREYSPADRTEFHETHKENSQRALQIMQDYLTLLNARDPNAVVVIFGDHGLIRSRGWSSDKGVKKLFPNAIKTLDERSIGLFVRPANFCTDKIRPDYRLQNLMGDLLQCMDAYTPKPASSG